MAKFLHITPLLQNKAGRYSWSRLAAHHIVGICLVLLFPLCSPSHSADKYISQSSRSEIKKGVNNYRIKIRRLRQGIRLQKSLAEDTLQQERTLLEELEEIDMRLQTQQKKVYELQLQVNDQQELIDSKHDQLSHLRAEKQKVQLHLQKRINAYYKMGNIGLLNVTFSTKTLPELLRFNDAFQSLIKYDQNVISTFRNKIDGLERARKALILEKSVLQEFIDRAVEEQRITDSIRMEKETLLVRIRTQKKLHDQAIREMEAATRQLSASLITLKTKEQFFEQSFTLNKGHLPPPVEGRVINLFQQTRTNKLGIKRKSDGISITAHDGSVVRAIAPGTVIFSGYLRGYGNTIIIHHGLQYYSVTSRLAEMVQSKGDKVETATAIGRMGDTATLFDEGLYFEIRHRKKSLNPLQWLDRNRLQLVAQSSVQQ